MRMPRPPMSRVRSIGKTARSMKTGEDTEASGFEIKGSRKIWLTDEDAEASDV
jgi:hypothetical protein